MRKNIVLAFTAIVIFLLVGCSDFLDIGPIPLNEALADTPPDSTDYSFQIDPSLLKVDATIKNGAVEVNIEKNFLETILIEDGYLKLNDRPLAAKAGWLSYQKYVNSEAIVLNNSENRYNLEICLSDGKKYTSSLYRSEQRIQNFKISDNADLSDDFQITWEGVIPNSELYLSLFGINEQDSTQQRRRIDLTSDTQSYTFKKGAFPEFQSGKVKELTVMLISKQYGDVAEEFRSDSRFSFTQEFKTLVSDK